MKNMYLFVFVHLWENELETFQPRPLQSEGEFEYSERRGGSVRLNRFLHFLSGKPTLSTLPDPVLAALRNHCL